MRKNKEGKTGEEGKKNKTKQIATVIVTVRNLKDTYTRTFRLVSLRG